MEKLRAVEREGLKTDIPAFAPGDTLRVMVRVREGEKERLQAFEGICIARRGGGINETFTVRRIVNNEGVERIFPLHSPFISKVTVRRSGENRRAKLFYLRDRVGKAVRLVEKRKVGKAEETPAAESSQSAKPELAGAAS